MSVNKWFKWRDKQHQKRTGASEDEDLKPFLDHLEDFRWMMIKSLAAAVIGMLIAFPLGTKMLYLLQRPLLAEGQRLQAMMLVRPQTGTTGGQITLAELDTRLKEVETKLEIEPIVEPTQVEEEKPVEEMALPADWLSRFFISTGPAEPFILWLKLSGWVGIILALPFIIFFIAEFVFPGLTDKERKMLMPSATAGLLLFLVGLSFCYFFVLPKALQIMIGIHGMMGMSVAWKLPEYIVFVTRLLLAFGVAFEMPLIVLALVKLGLVTSTTLREVRRHVIVGIFILAMILTPPDVFTQTMLAIPMVVLYEICIVLAVIIEKREKAYWDDEEPDSEPESDDPPPKPGRAAGALPAAAESAPADATEAAPAESDPEPAAGPERDEKDSTSAADPEQTADPEQAEDDSAPGADPEQADEDSTSSPEEK